MSESASHPGIATSSVEEGLDFACNLLVGALESVAASNSSDARRTLSSLAHYLSLRYAGELGLAFEELAGLAGDLAPHMSKSEQLQDQLRWLRNSLQLKSPDKSLERTSDRSSDR